MERLTKKSAKRLLGWIALAIFVLYPLKARAYDIGWNGFGSVYYGQAQSSDLLPNDFANTHVNFTTFSLMGLNLSGTISDQLSFGAQLLALGSPVGTSDAFALIAEWAYISYKPVDGLLIKGGRQLYGALLASEYAHVRYLLPYREIPAPVFLIAPFTRFDGVSADYSFDTGLGKVTAGIFGGSPELDNNTNVLGDLGSSPSLGNLIGAEATLDGDGWRVRASVSELYASVASTVIPPAFPTVTGHPHEYSAGYRFDKYNIVSWGEYFMVRSPDGSSSGGGKFIGNGHAYYILGGYRIGKFMPRYTFSQGSSTLNIPVAGSSSYGDGSITTHTIGLNYEAATQAIVKIEYEHDIVPTPPGPLGFFATGPATSTATTGDAFFAGVDFIF